MSAQEARDWYEQMSKADAAEAKAAAIRDRALEKQGWKQTCETPGSYWMWEKTIKDKRYVVTTDMAVSLTNGEAWLEVESEGD